MWRNLTPAERAKLRRDTSERLVSIFRSLPTEAEMASVALAGKAKRGWYRHSGEAIVHVFGPDAPRFAILLSALSPKVSVQENMRNALHVWKGWLDAGRPTDPQIINEILETAVPLVDDDGSRAIMDAWKNNAIRALSSAVPENVILSGPKVDSFYRNLVGIVNEVTNDAWMAIFAAVDQKIFGGSLTKTDPGKGPGYLAMSAKVRATARRLSKMTGETWTPAEVQETIWSWAKTLYEFSKTQGRTALDIIENNELTDAMIAATPDFRSLFHEDTYQDILAQAGYGERLRTLRDPRQDYAGAGDQAGGANSQADAAAPSPQKRHLQQAAKRIDKVKAQRQAQAQAQAQARAQAQAASPSESPDVRFSRRSPRTSSLGPLPQPPIPPRQQNAYQRTIARIDKLTDPESFD
ncbi:MAG: hypothetical protein EOM21_21235, partial [Gammaproteobacteria bacterium]|nr:hypothetical protein [Gammaproteobacteria bacterium]